MRGISKEPPITVRSGRGKEDEEAMALNSECIQYDYTWEFRQVLVLPEYILEMNVENLQEN